MKQFIDFIPLILFFIVYKIDPQNVEFAGFNLSGIYGATATLILVLATTHELNPQRWK